MHKYLVVGAGETGESILRFLSRHQIESCLFDTRITMPGLHDPAAVMWAEIEKVIVSPGVPHNTAIILEAKKRKLPLMGDIALFYQHAKAPIIAITGTNAKSTVTTLVTEMINATGVSAKMGGNIGIPALDLLHEATPDFYVLELSSFQLDLIPEFQAQVAVVLNVTADHLDRHGDFASYQTVKERIYQNSPHPVINRALGLQDPKWAEVAGRFSFGLDVPATTQDFGVREHIGARYLACGETLLLNAAELSQGLAGEHNLENALSALAITAPLNLPLAPQLQVLRQFQGLPHRCVLVATNDGVNWYNDSKGTNVGATSAALKGIGSKARQQLVLLLGGVAKDQDFRPLREVIQHYVREVIIFGQDREKIAADLQGLPCEIMTGSLREILSNVKDRVALGDTVLFSPACASYDMFKHFEDRGEQFTHIVQAFNR